LSARAISPLAIDLAGNRDFGGKPRAGGENGARSSITRADAAAEAAHARTPVLLGDRGCPSRKLLLLEVLLEVLLLLLEFLLLPERSCLREIPLASARGWMDREKATWEEGDSR